MRYDIPSPMLAKAAATVPEPAKSPGGLLFEPKWDGFRGLVSWDGETVEIGSRGAKPLTRYFPDLVEAIPRLLPGPCLLDGEIIVPTGVAGAQRLDWEALSQRIHPAASRVARLAAETPAMFIAFDLLAEGSDDLLAAPFAERRARLERMMARVCRRREVFAEALFATFRPETIVFGYSRPAPADQRAIAERAMKFAASAYAR